MTVRFKYKNRHISMNVHNDHIGGGILRGSTFYELGMLEFIASLGLNGLFIDVGANIGNHTVFFSKVLGQSVIAIEPQQDNYQILKSNIKENRLDPVGPMLAAAGSSMGKCAVTTVEDNMGMCRVVKGNDVPVITIDSLGLIPALIKVDVEGGEGKVIEGAWVTISEYKPHLFIETSDPKGLLSSLPTGYNIGKSFNHTPTYHFYASA